MKKLLLMISMVVLLVSCSKKVEQQLPSQLDIIETVSSTDLSLEMGGLNNLDVSETMIMDQRGTPKSPKANVKIGAKSYIILDYQDYRYQLFNDKLESYILQPGQTTAKKAQLGDNKERIVELYGTAYYTRKLGDATFIGYLDKEAKKVLEFLMDGNKAKMITASKLSAFE